MNRGHGTFGYGSTVQEYHDNPAQPYKDDPNFGETAGHRARSSTPQGSFNGLADTIGSNIFTIGNSATTLDRVLKQLGTSKDSADLRERIHETEKKTNSVIAETALQMKRLSAACNKGDRAQRLQVDRLIGEFKDVTQKYHGLQRKVADRAKLSAPPQSAARTATGTDLIGWQEPPEDDKSLLIDQRRKQAQMQEEALDVDVSLLREREEQIHQLEGDIVDINQIFKELGMLVHEQGAVVDTIEANVESAHADVESGTEQLQRAAIYQSKARKKKCCLITILLVVVAIIVIIIVVSVKYHK